MAGTSISSVTLNDEGKDWDIEACCEINSKSNATTINGAASIRDDGSNSTDKSSTTDEEASITSGEADNTNNHESKLGIFGSILMLLFFAISILSTPMFMASCFMSTPNAFSTVWHLLLGACSIILIIEILSLLLFAVTDGWRGQDDETRESN